MLVYTRQSIFDVAFIGLHGQKFVRSMGELSDGSDNPCRADNLYCRYRGDGGRKCAIGFALPDDVASRVEEMFGSALVSAGELEISDLNGKPAMIDFVESLQACHDLESVLFGAGTKPEGMSIMEFNLRNFATIERLTIPSV